MNVYDSGYGAWKFNKYIIEKRLAGILCQLKKIKAEQQPDCIVLHGSSGLWLGSALVCMQDLPVVPVRKPNESSHGYDVEARPAQLFRAVFVDDFICLGATVNRVMETLSQKGMQVVAVLEHGKSLKSSDHPGYYRTIQTFQALY